jgi:hypothetical protein
MDTSTSRYAAQKLGNLLESSVAKILINRLTGFFSSVAIGCAPAWVSGSPLRSGSPGLSQASRASNDDLGRVGVVRIF